MGILFFSTFGEALCNQAKLSFLLLLYSFCLQADRKADHLLYLSKIHNYSVAIEKYLSGNPTKHDPFFLQELAMSLIQKGANSSDAESQVTALFAASFANASSKLQVCRKILKNPPSSAHIAAIRTLGQLAEDDAEKLLMDQCSSPLIPLRFEAIFQLAMRKSAHALGVIESLESLLPPPYHVHLPQLVALIGTPQSDLKLKKFLNHEVLQVRLAALHSALKNHRFSCLSDIKSLLTHSHPGEKEAAAFALGCLRDTSAMDELKKLMTSPQDYVRLAALTALVSLGNQEAMETIQQEALKKNLFAIPLLTNSSSSKTLYHLMNDPNPIVSLNATLALLKKSDSKCLANVIRILHINPLTHFLSTRPSSGGAFCYFKLQSIDPQSPNELKRFYYFSTLMMQEQVLEECLHLSEAAFLHVSQDILQKRLYPLVPMTTQLLSTLGTPAAIRALKTFSQMPGEPFIRNYCCLALLRLGECGPYEKQLTDWLKQQNQLQLIQFRPIEPWTEKQTIAKHELTPIESSDILLQVMQILAGKKSHDHISLILQMMKTACPQNQIAFAGILLAAIQ